MMSKIIVRRACSNIKVVDFVSNKGKLRERMIGKESGSSGRRGEVWRMKKKKQRADHEGTTRAYLFTLDMLERWEPQKIQPTRGRFI
jgi:hypothetical protein